ncbi:MAG: GAF domain-containing protein [Spirochaetia bacterium]|nr:GAF domain-containing protein [Spirochaetia bacterium]
MKHDYDEEEILSIIRSFCEERVTSLAFLNGIFANISAYLYHTIEDVNWVGFYYLTNDDSLVLGPFQGEVACLVLPKGKGVCQKAVEERTSIIVDDVHQFATHIACDSKSRSEIVIPIIAMNKVAAVLDIDSPSIARFSSQLSKILHNVGLIINSLLIENQDYLDKPFIS